MKASILIPALLNAAGVLAAPYVVTKYVEESLVTYTEAAYRSSSTIVSKSILIETYSEYVSVTASSFAPITTITTTGYDDYADVTLVEIVVPTGVGTEAAYGYSEDETSYVVPVTYTPSATCSQNWTYSTNIPVYLPAIVTLPAATVSTTVSYYTGFGEAAPSPTTQIIAILNPTDVNSADLAAASSAYAPDDLSYCYTPTTYCPTAVSATCTPTFAYDPNSDGYAYSSSYYDYDDPWYRTVLIIAIAVPVGWVFLWLCIGFLESWLSFKGLMLGQKRKRGLPYSWCCLSVFFLCFIGPTYQAKSTEEQTELLAKWKELGAGKKFKLWMKWGFRWKYPDMIGEEPPIAKRPFRQGCL